MDLTTGKISEHLRKIAVPASIGFFFNTMYNVVDTLFAGFISTSALAALSISFPVFFIMIAFVTGLSTGASALISNEIGAGRQQGVRSVVAQIFSFAIIIYLIITPICLWVTPHLFIILGAEGNYLTMALSYMNLVFIGSIFFILLYSANAVLLAHGNSKIMRNYLIGGFFLNALLDPWFLFGGLGVPRMELAGIALATVCAMFVGCIYIIYHVYKEGHLKELGWRDYIPRLHYFYAIAQQSLPASFNMLTIGMGMFVITYFVKNYGEAAVAAYGICIRIEQIALLPTIGLTIAALNIAGQNNGAGRIDRIKETVKTATRWGLGIVGFGATLMFFLPAQIISIFTHDPEVIEIGSHYLKIAAFISGAYVLLSVNVSTMQGIKQPIYPLLIGMTRQLILPGIVFYTLTRHFDFGISGIWYGILGINWSAALFTKSLCSRLIQRIEIPSTTD